MKENKNLLNSQELENFMEYVRNNDLALKNISLYDDDPDITSLVLTTVCDDDDKPLIVRTLDKHTEIIENAIKEINWIFSSLEIDIIKFYKFIPTNQIFVSNSLKLTQDHFYESTNYQFKDLIFEPNNYERIHWKSYIVKNNQYPFSLISEIAFDKVGNVETKEIAVNSKIVTKDLVAIIER